MTVTPAYQVYVLSYYPESKKTKHKKHSRYVIQDEQDLYVFSNLYIYTYIVL